jgi:hypothetical protein
MHSKVIHLIVVAVFSLVLNGCASGGEGAACPAGEEGCACFDAGTCNAGLVCSDQVCMVGVPDSGAAGSGPVVPQDAGAPDTAPADAGPVDLCGNGVIDNDEQCDNNELNGETCGTLGEGSGTLTCDPASCTYDVSMCTGSETDSGYGSSGSGGGGAGGSGGGNNGGSGGSSGSGP